MTTSEEQFLKHLDEQSEKLHAKAEEYKPKTPEQWQAFADWHEQMINSLPCVKPMKRHNGKYFKFRFVKQ